MIPHTTDRNITIGGIDNAVQFSIATSGKAFRALIDTVYSDKVLAPVRELITNAADAHVAGGNPAPFKVIVPTTMDPTFGVRDYGTGMDHDTVTNLYTTLFASSKDGSNDETGMLGLGSKSPFAYTDTFTVEAFDGVSKRSYMAYTKDETPSLSLVGDTPSTEPRGICVKFPVQTHHRGQFVDAIYKVIRGLDTVPELDGVELVEELLFQTLRRGAGWKLVRSESETSQHLLRQGGVLYPLENRFVREAGIPDRRYYDHNIFVFDAPIGAADVTLSRESLSYDPQTEANIREIVKAAWEELQAQVVAEYEACTSQYEHMQWLNTLPEFLRDASAFNGKFDGWVMKGQYDLHPAHFKRGRVWTQDEMLAVKNDPILRYPTSVKENNIITNIAGNTERLMFVLDDGVTPRRRSRMLDWSDGNTRQRLMIHAGPEQAKIVKRLKALMHLGDEHFLPVADTYDPGPRTVSRGPVAKKSELQEQLDAGALWAERFRKNVIIRGQGNIPTLEYDIADLEYQFRAQPEFEGLITLTAHQVQTMAPDPANSLSALLWKEAGKHAAAAYSDRHEWRVRSDLDGAGCSHSKMLAEHLGFKDHRRNADDVVGRMVTNQYINFIVNSRTPPAHIAKKAQEQYPNLFPQPLDEQSARDYIQQQDTNPITTSQEATS